MDRAPIYIVGVGNLGKLVAYCLRKQSPTTPVTLLLHRDGLLSDWATAGQAIECGTPGGGVTDRQTGFAIEAPSHHHHRALAAGAPPPPPIKNLIVATKTYMTAAALRPLQNRLGHDSNVLLLQNGMGTAEELSATLFTDRASRPAYWAGISSAGVYGTGPFSIVHAGRGPLTIGRVLLDDDGGGDDDDNGGERQRHPGAHDAPGMIQRLLEARDLEAALATPQRLRAAQLRKLVVNATLNPLTAVFGCPNRDVFATPTRLGLLRLLIAETGPVVRALLGSGGDDDDDDEFSDERLLAGALLVAENTGGNVSSMLQDARAGRETEIDYINGYIASRAARLGLPAPRNAALVAMLKRRETATEAEVMERFTRAGLASTA
ncbi:hypothetical protein RB595_002548 [Gaeumannomyces hyphopodioides]